MDGNQIACIGLHWHVRGAAVAYKARRAQQSASIDRQKEAAFFLRSVKLHSPLIGLFDDLNEPAPFAPWRLGGKNPRTKAKCLYSRFPVLRWQVALIGAKRVQNLFAGCANPALNRFGTRWVREAGQNFNRLLNPCWARSLKAFFGWSGRVKRIIGTFLAMQL